MRLLNKKFHYNILSGNKSELSGVIPSNFNIAICKYIDEKKKKKKKKKKEKEKAFEVLKILTSKEMQKHFILSYDEYKSFFLVL